MLSNRQTRKPLAVLSPVEEAPAYVSRPEVARVRLDRAVKVKVALCLLLACLGASWFVSQLLLVPQPVAYRPDWQGARWVQATDGQAATAYFRQVIDLDLVPDSAFLTVAADQV